jgi:hypothetical protein
MKPAHYRHIGGVVVTDYGRVALSQARALALFYIAEAGMLTHERSHECWRRGRALENAVAAASAWRRAAGWADPDCADQPRSRD